MQSSSKITCVILLLAVIVCNVSLAKKKNKQGCSYDRGSWSECDAATRTKTFTKTLQHGSGQDCNATKTKTKKCRVGGCVYQKAPWGECDDGTNQVTRTRQLKHNADANCAPTQVDTKPCPGMKKRCKYTKPEWSECESGTKSRTLTLVTEGSGTGCQATKSQQKRC